TKVLLLKAFETGDESGNVFHEMFLMGWHGSIPGGRIARADKSCAQLTPPSITRKCDYSLAYVRSRRTIGQLTPSWVQAIF
ncbi:hypothetical protein, partial [Accumulibacter sp.]|uniref:hypothetical protein n=1 Tax=Accumulibacter sp. TaxID=2053492 RepID=UPI0028C49BEA